MQDDEWAFETRTEAHEVIEAIHLNVGGLVGALASIEGTGRFITGTRNDESTLKPKGQANLAAPALGDRLALHSIRDSQGRVLGLGAPVIMDNRGEDGNGGQEARGGWEAFTEAQTAHEGAVTGIDTVGGFGDLGGVSGVVTSGGDGCLRLFELAVGGEILEDESPIAGPSLALKGQVAAHMDRATGLVATRRRCVTVGEDGAVCLFDLNRLDRGFPGAVGRGGGGGSGGFAMWKGSAKGGLPLSGVAFQGESEEVFATTGCDPKGQLMVWDSRMDNRPAHVLTATGGSSDRHAPYLSVASQPFNPEVYACGISTGEVLIFDVRAAGKERVVHEMRFIDENLSGGGIWGVTFHPRRPRHLLACSGTGLLMRWFLPPHAGATGPYGNGMNGLTEEAGEMSRWRGVRRLFELPSRSALAGVCYDEGADIVSAVSKHGELVFAHGVAGLRL